jgi:hypothetical protein
MMPEFMSINRKNKRIKHEIIGKCLLPSVQNRLSFCVLSKCIKIKIHKATILPAVLDGFKTLYFIPREERTLMMPQNKVPRRTFQEEGK